VESAKLQVEWDEIATLEAQEVEEAAWFQEEWARVQEEKARVQQVIAAWEHSNYRRHWQHVRIRWTFLGPNSL
jgi:hypothetical protein